MREIILKGFKSMKKYSVLNQVKRLVIILLDPIYDVSQCCFVLLLNPFRNIHSHINRVGVVSGLEAGTKH